jgi:hypothetical protein
LSICDYYGKSRKGKKQQKQIRRTEKPVLPNYSYSIIKNKIEI